MLAKDIEKIRLKEKEAGEQILIIRNSIFSVNGRSADIWFFGPDRCRSSSPSA